MRAFSERGGGRRKQAAACRGPRGLWSLAAAVPLDVCGFYLALSALDLVPAGWPAAELPNTTLVAAALGLFAAARAIALVALRHLLNWRAASNDWSRTVVRDSHLR